MISILSKERLRALLASHDEHHTEDHWIMCSLCLGYTTFDEEEDKFTFQNGGVCRCGHPFSFQDKTGRFPRGKILIWDERPEP